MMKLSPLFIATLLLVSCSTPTPVEIDLLIKGATLVDGTGAKGFTGDIGIQADTIVFVGAAGASTDGFTAAGVFFRTF